MEDQSALIKAIMPPWVDKVDIEFLYNTGFEHAQINYLVNKQQGVSIRLFSDFKSIHKKKSFVYDRENTIKMCSFDDHPSYVKYDETGEIVACSYHVNGKKHSVNAQPEIKESGELIFWNDGCKNNNNIKKILNHLNVSFNYSNCLYYAPLLEIYYKNPDNVDSFLQLLSDNDVSSCDNVASKKILDFLNIAYQ